MLSEPERSIVQAWLDAGHRPQRIGFGVSGEIWRFGQTARRSGAWGAFKRYGGLHIEAAAWPYLAAGSLTAAQARVTVVWELLRKHGPLARAELASALALSERTAWAVIAELAVLRAIDVVTEGRRCCVVAVPMPRAPHWSDFLEPVGESRAA